MNAMGPSGHLPFNWLASNNDLAGVRTSQWEEVMPRPFGSLILIALRHHVLQCTISAILPLAVQS